jgi:HK97 family phage major capsid protein
MWKQLKAAKEQRGAMVQQMQNLLSKAETEKRDLSPEEVTDFDGLTKQVEAKDAEIRRLETVCGLSADGQPKPGEQQRNQPGRGDTDPDGDKPVFDQRDLKDYSLVRAIATLARRQPLGGLEAEVSQEIAKRAGKDPQGFYFPTDLAMTQTRDLTLTTGSGAKPTVTDAANFIGMLRNKTLVSTLGARMLTGLTGDLSLPKQTGGATAYWVTEGNAPTESNQTIGQVALAPKTVGAFTDISRKFIAQSSLSAEAFVRDDLATVLAIEIDRAAVNGSGTGAEPEGILQNSSVTTVAGGTNGAAPTFAMLVAMETAVANANADMGSLHYLTNSKVRGVLKTTEKATGTAQFVWRDDNTVNGYAAHASNQVPATLTKGSGTALSAAIFGNWSDLVIGMWGGLDILVDPYTGSTSGTVRVTALQDIDIKLRNAVSFAKMVDLIA